MAQPNKKLKFGVIGAGKIGTFHSRTLAAMPEVELVGICDSNIIKSQELAWTYNCMPFSNYKDMLSQVDAVVAAVPTQLHKQIAFAAIERGVHCLVEKPIATTMEEAREMIELAKEKKVLLQVGHSERFNPAVTEAFKHIKSPRFIVIERLGPYDPRMSAIGVVLDLMIHDIDLLYTMLDSDVESFEAIGASIFSEHEDIANVRLRFKNGVIAEVTASRASLERARYMRVYQDNSYLSVDFMNARVKTYRKKAPVLKDVSDIEVVYPPLEKTQPIKAELLHFIDCIHHMKTPWPSGERGRKALELALQITEQLKRYEVSRHASPEPPGPIRVVTDIGKATKMVLTETFENIGK